MHAAATRAAGGYQALLPGHTSNASRLNDITSQTPQSAAATKKFQGARISGTRLGWTASAIISTSCAGPGLLAI